MVLKGILLIVLIIFSAVFLIVSLIMTVVRFNSSGKKAVYWLIGFVISLAVLIASIFMLIRGVVGKAQEFAGDMEEFGREQVERMDSLNNLYTNSNDSILDSRSVNYLIGLEPDTMKGRVPQQFYSYMGFRDYYRLPIVWPYSLHCMDSLGDASLYDERRVEQFDVNDNGEITCGLSGVMDFAFNKEYIVGSKVKIENKPKRIYFTYHFKTGKEMNFKTEQELFNYAKSKGFEVMGLKSCKRYYNEF